MVEKIEYFKGQTLVDKNGKRWILVDIVETKSLLRPKQPARLTAYIRPEDETKTYPVAFEKLQGGFVAYLLKDPETLKKIKALGEILSLEALHPCAEEN